MDFLFERTNETSDSLAKTLRDAHIVQSLQAEASRSVVDLVRSVVELTEKTHDEIGKINGTAYEIQQLLVQRGQREWPWSDIVRRILGLVWRGRSLNFCRVVG